MIPKIIYTQVTYKLTCLLTSRLLLLPDLQFLQLKRESRYLSLA